MRERESERGLSLLELLIAILIVGVIASAAIPLFNDYTESARAARAEANLASMQDAVDRYSADHKAPWGFVFDPNHQDLIVAYEFPEYQLERPTDAYGNVLGETPAGSVVGTYGAGPYVVRALSAPASILLAPIRPPGGGGPPGGGYEPIAGGNQDQPCLALVARFQRNSGQEGLVTCCAKFSFTSGPRSSGSDATLTPGQRVFIDNSTVFTQACAAYQNTPGCNDGKSGGCECAQTEVDRFCRDWELQQCLLHNLQCSAPILTDLHPVQGYGSDNLRGPGQADGFLVTATGTLNGSNANFHSTVSLIHRQ